jgi:hypothetical protein
MTSRWKQIVKETFEGSCLSAGIVSICFILCCGFLNFNPGIEPAFLISGSIGALVGFLIGGIVAFIGSILRRKKRLEEREQTEAAIEKLIGREEPH